MKNKLRLGYNQTVQVPNTEEIQEAESYWIKCAQCELKKEDSAVLKSTPFLDNNSIIRVSGRIGKSLLFEYNRKHPMILPSGTRVSELIVRSYHEDLFHPGHLRVMAEVQKKYWIIGCRKIAKRIGYNCVTCRYWRGKSIEQIMSPLPDCRLSLKCSPF